MTAAGQNFISSLFTAKSISGGYQGLVVSILESSLPKLELGTWNEKQGAREINQ